MYLVCIRTDPFKSWHAIWTFQFMFIFLAYNSDAPEIITNLLSSKTVFLKKLFVK